MIAPLTLMHQNGGQCDDNAQRSLSHFDDDDWFVAWLGHERGRFQLN